MQNLFNGLADHRGLTDIALQMLRIVQVDTPLLLQLMAKQQDLVL